MTKQEKLTRIAAIEKELNELPKGKVFYKNIKGKQQPYLQWSEAGKQNTKYVKIEEREKVFADLARRDQLMEVLEKIRKTPEEQTVSLDAVQFHTNVVMGKALEDQIARVKGLQRRDCYGKLQRYIQTETYGKVCILYGLRRTGKTTLLFQLIEDLSPEERAKAVYIKAQAQADRLVDLSADLKKLRELGYQYAFLDEVTLMEDFIDCASILSDIYAMQGMKIILSGTDSLGFWMAEGNELYDRAYMIHTTYIPFREYSRVLGIHDVDEYIRYGGTLMPGETNFDDPDALDDASAFRDDESTRRYIDTAICRNIQHSLAHFENGNYFRHLRELYEANELTSAINRIIESMNHQFLLRVLTAPFKSHMLGSASQLLQKQREPENRTDILERINIEQVTQRLMELLEIRNQEDQKIGITPVHVAEIKEYLKALDLVVDCPAETTVMDAQPSEYVIFTQPGMRYCQAQALVHYLMKDPIFQEADEREKTLATKKILEDVLGRMMEDIVLLDRMKTLPRDKRAFKLVMSRKEYDMVVYDSEAHTHEDYEIKHSVEIVPQQAQALLDESLNKEVKAKFGDAVRKCVIYRGNSQLDGPVEYINVEEYLEGLVR